MSDESDNFEFSDNEIDEKKHEKLVENVLNLNKVQHVKKPSRTEPTLQISEFNLVKSVTGNKGSVQLTELTKVLKGRKKHIDISKKLQLTNKKSKTLPKPLEKPQAERVRRTVNYEKARLDWDRWEALVTSNRAALHQKFPLDSVGKIKITQKKAEKVPETWRVKSDLQKELEKLEPKVEEYHVETEEEKEFPLSVDELKAKRKEAAKLRAHQSFKEAKARRQNKIKSKKYHRILRREKIKQKLKEFEELQKTNPEEALKKLEDIEKARAEERFSLRHKGTGQWAKSKQVRAKYDKESRQVLAQQLAISRDLTQKLKATNSDSEDEGFESGVSLGTPLKSAIYDGSNPWVKGMKPDKEVVDFVSGYRKFWNEQNKIAEGEDQNGTIDEENQIENKEKQVNSNSKEKKTLKIKKNKEKSKKNNKNLEKKVTKVKANLNNSSGNWEVESDIDKIFDTLENKLEKKLKQKLESVQKSDNIKKTKKIKKPKVKKLKKAPDLTLPSKSKKHKIDEKMVEEQRKETREVEADSNEDVTKLKNILQTYGNEEKVKNIDPSKFIKVNATKLNTSIPDILTVDENDEADENDQRDVIMEAFEDDNIVQDFNTEKSMEIEEDKPKDIDLNLPGWGSWGGAMIDPKNQRKRKRFILKMPEKLSRRDDNKGSLIINEKAQKKIREHLVSEVPFPFKTIKDYEASIRAPIGNTFVPETAFRKLIQPSVVTKMGAIIEPIKKNMLSGKKKV